MNDNISKEVGQLFSEYMEQLEKESERGTVIVSAALMDEALEELIKAMLVPSPGKEDKLFDGAYAPLDSFSAKIDFAYRLGIIASLTRDSLHLIRKLRNDFAHSALHMSFETNSVKNRIRELFKLNKVLFDVFWDVENDGQRRMFEILVSLIAYSLRQRNRNIEPLKSWADRTKKT